MSKIVTWEYCVYDSTESTYAMILVRDLLTALLSKQKKLNPLSKYLIEHLKGTQQPWSIWVHTSLKIKYRKITPGEYFVNAYVEVLF